MNIIGRDEAEMYMVNIGILRELKKARNKGFVFNDEYLKKLHLDHEYVYSKDEAVYHIIECLVGEDKVEQYEAYHKDSKRVGYEIQFEDTVINQIIKITHIDIMRYLNIFKKLNLLPYVPKEIHDINYDLNDKGWDYDFTECIVGKNYSGYYIQTTSFDFPLHTLISTLTSIILFCKDFADRYNRGEEIELIYGRNERYLIRNKIIVEGDKNGKNRRKKVLQ